ncbi:unnamed protein product [Toxocara canis]|uniref:Secreted protein n=1 Tax=Toxocara canis TaxID=6265 RepID=A0A183U4M6_TOXCA|nr:unnamed protein product [Toxocara canis]
MQYLASSTAQQPLQLVKKSCGGDGMGAQSASDTPFNGHPVKGNCTFKEVTELRRKHRRAPCANAPKSSLHP